MLFIGRGGSNVAPPSPRLGPGPGSGSAPAPAQARPRLRPGAGPARPGAGPGRAKPRIRPRPGPDPGPGLAQSGLRPRSLDGIPNHTNIIYIYKYIDLCIQKRHLMEIDRVSMSRL